jgi:hypothetical protein
MVAEKGDNKMNTRKRGWSEASWGPETNREKGVFVSMERAFQKRCHDEYKDRGDRNGKENIFHRGIWPWVAFHITIRAKVATPFRRQVKTAKAGSCGVGESERGEGGPNEEKWMVMRWREEKDIRLLWSNGKER